MDKKSCRNKCVVYLSVILFSLLDNIAVRSLKLIVVEVHERESFHVWTVLSTSTLWFVVHNVE